MVAIEQIGTDHKTGRRLYVIDAPLVGDVPSFDAIVGRCATMLVVWDASGVEASTIANLARKLIDQGGICFCTWGADCERVHDVIDETWVGDGTSTSGVSPLMTTWHDDVPLDDAVWFALYSALTNGRNLDDCHSLVASCIACPNYADQVRAAFADTVRFAAAVLGSSPDYG